MAKINRDDAKALLRAAGDLTSEEVKQVIRAIQPSEADIAQSEREIKAEATAAKGREVAGLSGEDFAELQRSCGVKPYGDMGHGVSRVDEGVTYRPDAAGAYRKDT